MNSKLDTPPGDQVGVGKCKERARSPAQHPHTTVVLPDVQLVHVCAEGDERGRHLKALGLTRMRLAGHGAKAAKAAQSQNA